MDGAGQSWNFVNVEGGRDNFQRPNEQLEPIHVDRQNDVRPAQMFRFPNQPIAREYQPLSPPPEPNSSFMFGGAIQLLHNNEPMGAMRNENENVPPVENLNEMVDVSQRDRQVEQPMLFGFRPDRNGVANNSRNNNNTINANNNAIGNQNNPLFGMANDIQQALRPDQRYALYSPLETPSSSNSPNENDDEMIGEIESRRHGGAAPMQEGFAMDIGELNLADETAPPMRASMLSDGAARKRKNSNVASDEKKAPKRVHFENYDDWKNQPSTSYASFPNPFYNPNYRRDDPGSGGSGAPSNSNVSFWPSR